MSRLFVWLMRALLVPGLCLALVRPNEVRAQSSSLFRRTSTSTPGLAVRPSHDAPRPEHTALQKMSYFSAPPPAKRVFKVHDQVTVIVRHKATYKNVGKADLEREIEFKAELKDWVRFSDAVRRWKLVPDTLPAGDPKINFDLQRSTEGDGKINRSDELITRLQCEVIDVLPNKTLVLEGSYKVITDGEEQSVTLTGKCRSKDITADNTILSTQVAALRIERDSKGAVRDAMRRGWAYKIWDWIRPF